MLNHSGEKPGFFLKGFCIITILTTPPQIGKEDTCFVSDEIGDQWLVWFWSPRGSKIFAVMVFTDNEDDHNNDDDDDDSG